MDVPVFKFVSYNMHGFNQGIMQLKTICESMTYNVIFIQETWLTPDKLPYFLIFREDYHIFCVSSMDTTLGKGILKGRPHRGLCILVNKVLNNSFTNIKIVSNSDRYLIISI